MSTVFLATSSALYYGTAAAGSSRRGRARESSETDLIPRRIAFPKTTTDTASGISEHGLEESGLRSHL